MWCLHVHAIMVISGIILVLPKHVNLKMHDSGIFPSCFLELVCEVNVAKFMQDSAFSAQWFAFTAQTQQFNHSHIKITAADFSKLQNNVWSISLEVRFRYILKAHIPNENIFIWTLPWRHYLCLSTWNTDVSLFSVHSKNIPLNWNYDGTYMTLHCEMALYTHEKFGCTEQNEKFILLQ